MGSTAGPRRPRASRSPSCSRAPRTSRPRRSRALAEHHGIGADLWSATSYKRLREDALSVERWNRLHPDAEPDIAPVTAKLGTGTGPVIAVTDFMKAVPDQISRWVPDGRTYTSLGTDGFGRSDTREALRHFFETDAGHVVVAVLSELVRSGAAKPDEVAKGIRHGLDADAPDPRTR